MGFAHPSEQLMADLLDYYGIRWEYEPRTFVLETDADGNIASGFTPDFYLPDFDSYLELTTLRPPTRKHRKLRKLRDLYPDVKVCLLDRRDIAWIGSKHGIAVAA